MWQTPVYDRTAADVAAGAEKCYITAELLNRIEGNTAHMAQLLGVEIDTRTWTSLGLLTRAQMQRIFGQPRHCAGCILHAARYTGHSHSAEHAVQRHQ